MRLWLALRDAPFLTRERVFLYGMAVAFVCLVLVSSGYWLGWWFVDREGRKLPVDFLAFWAAGFLTAGSPAGAIYDNVLYKAVQIRAIGHDFDVQFYWPYPPILLLVATQLAVLPYYMAWFLWVVVTAALFGLALRRILPGRLAAVFVLSAPASVWCALVGQNGFLTAGLMAGALGLLEERPLLAGVCMGLLTYKPQFGILFPFFLLVTRQGRAFAAAAATFLLLAALSALCFGLESWRAFVASLSHSGDFLLAGGSSWFKLQSIYAELYQIVPQRDVALAGHLAFCTFLVIGLLWLWTRAAPMAVKSAALVAGAFLVTPYAYIYDSVMLTTGVALLAGDGLRRGFLPWEKLGLLLALIPPAFFLVLGSVTAPLEACMILGLAMRRAVWGGRFRVAGRREVLA